MYGYKFLVQVHPLNNIEFNNYFNFELRFNGIFSRNNLSRIKDAAYVLNPDDKKRKEHIEFH